MKPEWKLRTLAVQAGMLKNDPYGAVNPPVYFSSTFRQRVPGHPLGGTEYGRTGNPTRWALEEALGALEGGQALVFASGLAAMDAVLHLLAKGDRVVCEEDVYAGTRRILDRVYGPLGVEVEYRDFSDPAAYGNFAPNTRLVWVETPTNPLLKVVDIARLAEAARAQGIWLAVDNTFATPVLQRPLDLGATFSVYSTTKYLSGHSDIIGGAVVTRDPELYERLKYIQNAVGAVPSPMDSFLVLRGLRTLPLRMQAHSANARRVAAFLREHPKVVQVYFTDDNPVARKQMADVGGMVSAVLDTDRAGLQRFLDALEIFQLAESFGGVESLVNHPATMTHAYIPEEERVARGIVDTLLRISVGVEDPDDLVADLARALERV